MNQQQQQNHRLRMDSKMGPLWGDIGLLKLTFSEYGHVSYQIKGNDAYNYMSANVLPLHTSLTPGGTKGLFSVSSHVACLIKR